MKAHNYVEHELCRRCFSRNFGKIFRTAVFKEYFPMDVPYFIKWKHISECFWWCNTQRKKKKLVEVNPPQGWLWKQNGTTVMAAVMIFEVVNNRKSVSQINILIKRTLNPNHLPLQEIYITIIILRWLVSTWRICSKEISEVKHLKLSDYLNQI